MLSDRPRLTLQRLSAWHFYQRHGWQDLGPRGDEPSVHLLHKDLSRAALT